MSLGQSFPKCLRADMREETNELSQQEKAKRRNEYSPGEVDRVWGIWGSYYNTPKAIFYLPKGII